MEELIKQIRVRFSGVPQAGKEERSNIRERKIAPQKSQSFKGEKSSQSWLKRQFSRHMSRDVESSDGGEYVAAVAAAAFAIITLEEDGTEKASLTKMRSKEEHNIIIEHGEETKMKSNNEDAMVEPGKVSKRLGDHISIKVSDQKGPISSAEGKTLEKSIGATPSIRKAATFADDKQSKHAISTRQESRGPKQEMKRQILAKPAVRDSEADAWEKSEMAKLEKRFEKLNTMIREWEVKKKTKAKNKREKIEREVEGKRAKAMQEYRSEVETVNRIAEGARAQAKERRRNEETKVKEKADRFRSTGKRPFTCFFC